MGEEREGDTGGIIYICPPDCSSPLETKLREPSESLTKNVGWGCLQEAGVGMYSWMSVEMLKLLAPFGDLVLWVWWWGLEESMTYIHRSFWNCT